MTHLARAPQIYPITEIDWAGNPQHPNNPNLNTTFDNEPSNKIAIFKTSIWLTLILLGAILALQDHFIPTVLGTVILGVMFAHGVELQHQCLHNSLFSLKRINTVLGNIFGLPMLVSFHHYKHQHLFHHRYLGTKKDKEFFHQGAGMPKFISIFRIPIIINSLLNIIRSYAKLSPLGLKNGTSSTLYAQREYRIFGVSILLLLIFAALNSNVMEYILKLWVVPMLFIAGPTHFLIELPEHISCNAHSTNPYLNTRSITGSWFSFWITNGNNLHVEHHTYPSLPIDKLPKIHRNTPTGSFQYLNKNYLEFYSEYLSNHLKILRFY